MKRNKHSDRISAVSVSVKKIVGVALGGGLLVSLSFLGSIPQAGAATILNIQTKGASTSGATSLTVPLASTGAGNLIAVGILSEAGVTSIVDSKSDVFTQASSMVVAGETFAIYYAKNVAGGVTSVTANFPFGGADMIVGEYSGIDTVSPLDQVKSNDNGFVSGTSYTSGVSAQTSQASELLWGFSANAYSDTPAWTPTAPWAAKLTQGNSFAQEQIVASQGSYAASGVVSNVSSNYRIVSLLATFKAGGAVSPDTTPPSVPTNLSASAVSSSQINLSWTASTDNVGVAGYTVFRNGVQVGTTAGTSYSDTGLSASTTYTYNVSAFDAAGNNSAQSSPATATTQAPPPPDTTPPVVSVTAPTNGATVSGVVSVSASASDNVGVAGVQFKLDGVNLGSEVTAAPYTISWDTTLAANGTHTVSAVARDAAGNTATASVSVTVNNIAPPPQTSGAPALFFSDLTSGSKTGGENNNGVYVTLFGNFGSNPTVTVGGGQAIIKTAPTTWNWYQKMSIQLGPNAQTGNIVVTNANGSSKGLPFVVRSGNIYCVSTTGSDSNNGQFTTDPTPLAGTKGCWATLNQAKNTIAPGDVAYALNGVSVTVPECAFTAYLCMDNNGGDNSGTAANPKALVVYPGATATIGQTGTSAQPYGLRTPNIPAAEDYWVVSQFTIRANMQANDIGGLGWRFIANDLSANPGEDQVGCSQFSTGDVTGTGPMMFYYGNNVHGCGPSPASEKNYHAVYFSTDTNHVDAAWNYIHDNLTCRAMQFHSSPTVAGVNGFNQYDLHVHDNIIHDDSCNGINFATIDPSKGPVEAYNNLIYNTGLRTPNDAPQPSGDCIYSAGFTNDGNPGTGVVQVYNNTLYNCGVELGNGSAVGGFNNTNLSFNLRNNVIYQLSGEPFTDGTSPITGSNNIFFGLGNNGTVPSGFTNTLSTNPLFVAAGTNFHLQSGSPAINSGLAIGSLTTDLDGAPRPQGGVYDRGAYEFNGSSTTGGGDTTPPSTPSGLTVTGTTTSTVSLLWSASTDNVGVAGYNVYRNGSQVATAAGTSYMDTGLAASTTYVYTVAAFDAAGNVSAQSASASATTQFAPAPPPGPAFVQSASLDKASGGTTVAVTMPKSVGAGDLLTAVCYWSSASATASISDSKANAWKAIGAPQKGVGSLASYRTQSFYAMNVASGTTSITCRTSASVSDRGLAVHEVSGIATSAALDKNAIGAGTNASVATSPAITTTAASEYLMGACVVQSSISGATSPWTLRENSNFASNGTEDLVVNSTSTYQASFANSGDYTCLVNSFVGAAISSSTGGLAAVMGGSSTGGALTGGTSSITFLQSTSQFSGSASVSSSKVSFTAANQAGNLIIVSMRWGNAGQATVSDSLGNTYIPMMQLTSPTGASAQIFYAANIKGGANTITAKLGTASTRVGLAIHEYSGAALTNPVDAEVHQIDATSPLAGSLVTKNPNDLLFAGTTADNANVTTWTAGPSFSLRQKNARQATEDRIAGAAGAYSGSFVAATGTSFISELIALKPAGALAVSAPSSNVVSREPASRLQSLADRLMQLSHSPQTEPSTVKSELADILSIFKNILADWKNSSH